MVTYEVRTTYKHGDYQALRVAHDISLLDFPEKETVKFDFTKYAENTPFSNLLIANTIRNYKKVHKNNCTLIPNEGTYLSHLGFYQMIGADYGKKLGEAHANDNYIPITKIEFDSNFYREIERKSEDIAALLKFDRQLSSFLKYFFIEAIRNTYEHADVGEVYLSAQKWPSQSELEIAISDDGCGICNSLCKYEPYSNETEENLIKLACEPGVSARSNYNYLERDSVWRNSGYGLYGLKKLAVTYGGRFLICSGNYALSEDRRESKILDTKYCGTTIAIRIKTNMNIDFRTELDRTISEGMEESREMRTAIHSASMSSGGHYDY